MQGPFRFIFIIINTVFETYSSFSFWFLLNYLNQSINISPTELHLNNELFPVYPLKVRQSGLLSAAAQAEKNKAALRRNKSSRNRWESTAPAQRGTKSRFSQIPLPFKGQRKWFPEASLVTTLSSSQTRLGIVNSQHYVRPDTRLSVSMAISPL